jgi:formyl-CoA transferase
MSLTTEVHGERLVLLPDRAIFWQRRQTLLVADPHFAARGMFETQRMGSRDVVLPGIVPRLSQTPGRTRWIGPRLGEHTESVLEALGYGGAEIAALRGRRVIA